MPAAALGVGQTVVPGASAGVAGVARECISRPTVAFRCAHSFLTLEAPRGGDDPVASSTGDPLAFPFGSRRSQAPLLAVLALAGAACFGGSRSEVAGPMPSPLGAGGSAAAVEAARDSAPAPKTPAMKAPRSKKPASKTP